MPFALHIFSEICAAAEVDCRVLNLVLDDVCDFVGAAQDSQLYYCWPKWLKTVHHHSDSAPTTVHCSKSHNLATNKATYSKVGHSIISYNS